MRPLNRLLLVVRKSAASLPMAGPRHPGTPEHVRRCADCAAAVRRQREYLERLRKAAVPAASDELTARLLLRTRELAMAPAAPAPQPRPFRLAGLAAGGVAMAAAGAVIAGAYISAGEPRQYAAAAFSGQAGPSADAAGSGGTAAGGSPGQCRQTRQRIRAWQPCVRTAGPAPISRPWAFTSCRPRQRSTPDGRPLSCASRMESTRQPSWNSTPHRQPAARRRPPRRLSPSTR